MVFIFKDISHTNLGTIKIEKKFRGSKIFRDFKIFPDCFDSTNLKLNYLEQELSYHGENKLFILHKKK